MEWSERIDEEGAREEKGGVLMDYGTDPQDNGSISVH